MNGDRPSTPSWKRVLLLWAWWLTVSAAAAQDSPVVGDLRQGEQFARQKRWADARVAFDRAAQLVSDHHRPEARRAVEGAVVCSLQLDEWQEAWDRVQRFRRREHAQPAERRHWTRWDHETSEARDARLAVEHFESVRGLLLRLADYLDAHPAEAARRRESLTAERIDLDFTVVRYLFGPGLETRYVWHRDTDWWWDVPDRIENERPDDWWGYGDRGVPLGPDGRPQFVQVPERYTAQLSSGAKVLYLLNEVERLDTTPTREHAARALLRRAEIARRLYGPSSDSSWDSAEFYYAYDSRPSFLGSYRGLGLKPYRELADDEARTLVGGHLRILALPTSESPLALLRQVERKYPRSASVPEAIYLRGLYYQSRQQFARALDEYQALRKRYPDHPRARDAERRLDAIRHADVLLGKTGFYPAGSKPRLWFAHRQTDKVEFVARAFDLPRFVRETGPERLRNLDWELLSIVDGRSDSSRHKPLTAYLGEKRIRWSEAVPRAERVTTQTTTAPLSEVGAYLVEARVPGRQEPSVALVVLTDLVLVPKPLARKTLLYVADARTGRPVAGQKVHVCSEKGQKWSEATHTTNADGVVETEISSDFEAVAVAVSAKGGLAKSVFRTWYRSLDERKSVAYAVTDRPVYRPGDTVHFRVWARELTAERTYLRPRADQPMIVEITDAHRNVVRTVTLHTDRFGAVSGDYPLSPEASLGEYALSFRRPDSRYGERVTWFRVEMYRKPEFEVTVRPADGQVRPGGRLRVGVAARYYFGGPVAAGLVRYRVSSEPYQAASPRPQAFDWLYETGYGRYGSVYPWLADRADGDSVPPDDPDDDEAGRESGLPILSGEARLNDAGTVDLDIDTAALRPYNQSLTIEAEVRDASRRTIRATGTVIVAARDLSANLELDRPWYGPEDRAQLVVRLNSATGAGVAAKGTLRLLRIRCQETDHREVRTEVVQSEEATTDGQGVLTRRLPPLPEGRYRAEFQTRDARNQQVRARAVFWVHGPRFDARAFRYPELEILPDRRTYQVGETAHLLVHVARSNARVLWSDDARRGRLLNYRFLDVANHVAVIPVRIEARHVPNFFVEATVVNDGRTHVEACEVLVPPVADLLRVRVEADKTVYRPGEGATVRVAVTDAAGKPAAGQVTLAAYDKAVTYIQDETGIGPNVLIAKRRTNHEPAEDEFQWGWRAVGKFICPEFEIYDDGHMMIGAMAGAPPTGGDPAGGERQRVFRPAPPPGPAERTGNERPTEPIVRRNFADTALWRAALDLGPDGTATAKLAWPESLTTWRLRAYALTASTQVGDATGEVKTARDFLVRLQTPRFLVEGDEVVVSANVHSTLGRDERVTAELIVPAALLSSLENAHADAAGNVHLQSRRIVKAGGSERFDWPLRVLCAGTAKVTVKAVAETDADATEVTLPVLPHGAREETAWAGALEPAREATKTLSFTVPEKRVVEDTFLEVSLAAGPGGALLDALPWLMDYPYGCTEQTMSRFYPTVIAADTLKKLGTDLEALARRHRQETPKLAGRFHGVPAALYDSAELRRMAEAGLERLYTFQHDDGGWGWWQDDNSSPYMTAYVLQGLQVTRRAGLEVRPHALDYGYYYLFTVLDPRSGYAEASIDLPTQTAIAYVLSWAVAHKGEPGGVSPERADAENRETLAQLRDRLFRRRGDLRPYSLALLALALHDGRQPAQANEVLHDLLRHIERDDNDGTAHVINPAHHGWRWWDSDVETNAWALRALVRLDPRNELAPRLARWLVLRRRHGTYWDSTRDSALAVAALAEYLLTQKAEVRAGRAVVRLDGRLVREVDLATTPDERLVLDGAALAPGRHVLAVEKTGAGDLYYAGRFRTFARAETLRAASKGLAIRREYFRLAADGSARTPLADDGSVAVGDLIEVVLTIDAADDYEYLAFEDPRPAGCEPVQLQSGGLWLDWTWTNVELRDDRAVFFMPYLDRGRHVLRYRLRAETPGKFRVLPVAGFAMYAPEVWASSGGGRLRVDER